MAGIEGGSGAVSTVSIESGLSTVGPVAPNPLLAPPISPASLTFESSSTPQLANFPGLIPLEIGSAISPDSMRGNSLIDSGWVEANVSTLVTFQAIPTPESTALINQAENIALEAWNNHLLIEKTTVALALYFGTYGISIENRNATLPSHETTPSIEEVEQTIATVAISQVADKGDLSSDQAIAKNVVQLAEELGMPELVEEVEREFLTVDEGVDTENKEEVPGQKNNNIQELTEETDEQTTEDGQEQETNSPQEPIERQEEEQKEPDQRPDEPMTFRVSEPTNLARISLLASLSQNTSHGFLSSRHVASIFDRDAPNSPVIGQLGIGGSDGGKKEITQALVNASSTKQAIISAGNRAIANNPGIILASLGTVASEAAVIKVIGPSRRNPFRRNEIV